MRAFGWWLAQLRHRPPARHSGALTRRSFIVWTFASGGDRWWAASLIDAAGSCWYILGQPLQCFWDQLLRKWGTFKGGFKEVKFENTSYSKFEVSVGFDNAITMKCHELFNSAHLK